MYTENFVKEYRIGIMIDDEFIELATVARAVETEEDLHDPEAIKDFMETITVVAKPVEYEQ